MEIELKKYRLTFTIIFLTIGVVIGILFFYNIKKEKSKIKDLALEQAKASFNKDLAYRRWSAKLGGVYVAVSDSLKPNPYLKIENREILDTNGKVYTLVNPAYMTRMVHELAKEQYKTKGSITSLNPINPQNAPDTWERNALLQFEKGTKEYFSIEKNNGKEYLRYIHAMYVEKPCLRCHEVQGYKIGDVRGAISVDIPIAPYLQIYKENKLVYILSYGAVYLISFLILYLSYKFLKSEVIKRTRSQLNELKKAKRHKEIIQSAIDGFIIFDQNLHIREVNKALTEILGYSEQEFLTMKISDIEHINNNTENKLKEEVFKKYGRISYKSIFESKNKNLINVEISLTEDTINKSLLICFVKNITKNVESEKKLKHAKLQIEKSEEKYRNLVETSHELIWQCDEKGRFTYLNKAWEYNLGYKIEEMLGYTSSKFQKKEIFEKDFQTFTAKLGTGKINNYETIFLSKNGSEVILLVNAMPILNSKKQITGAQGTAVNITERKKYEQNLENLVQERTEKLEASNEVLVSQSEELRAAIYKFKMAQNQLIQSEKMASLGILVAGVAHEINNPVNFINSSISGLKNNLDYLADFVNFYDQINETNFKQIQSLLKQKEVSLNEVFDMFRKSIEIIEIGVQRTTKIVKGLKSFARADETELAHYNVNENIDNTLIILYNQYKNRIQILKEYNKIPEIICYAGQINQVLMNILINAIQAIKDEGEILITTDTIKDEKVLIEIKDNGQGIPEEKLKRIFDPFFTTKKVGEGTGLGLSISYGIIKEHGGEIEVESILGNGTIFKIILPIKHPEYINGKKH